MQFTYKYRLKPTKPQAVTIPPHLELGRPQDNYRLGGEKIKWWEAVKTPINAGLLTASIVSLEEIYKNISLTRVQTREGRKKDGCGNPLTKKDDVFSKINEGNVQWLNVGLSDLKNTKKLFPDYKSLASQVLQD